MNGLWSRSVFRNNEVVEPHTMRAELFVGVRRSSVRLTTLERGRSEASVLLPNLHTLLWVALVGLTGCCADAAGSATMPARPTRATHRSVWRFGRRTEASDLPRSRVVSRTEERRTPTNSSALIVW